jgi:predicted CXXCH cytochrome family protein
MWRQILALLVIIAPLPVWAAQDVANTRHNLSTSGPGPFKSMTVSQICVFCHTPHNASPSVPLWNHKFSGATYIEYGSSTLKANPGQPTGTSRLCLSCHDGTVALGALRNPPRGVKVDIRDSFLQGRANLGTDLSDDHPVSFAYDRRIHAANPELAHPARVNLPLERGELQCVSCHDPHEKDIEPFLHKTTLNGELCTTCHEIVGGGQSWAASAHATSSARPSESANPWGERKRRWRGQTVAENACFNCHTPHNAVTPARLIKDREEQTCFLCHNGQVARTDIESESRKPYRHPVDLTTGVHDPTEDFVGRPPDVHVECSDCHDPHGAAQGRGRAPFASPAVAGVAGIDSAGAPVEQARREYEICTKCHGDNNVISNPRIVRQVFEINTRYEFDPSNPSHHPVQGVGRNANVPSLISPLNETTVIYCTDCHNSDSSRAGGGRGANGPHGSIYEGLLERNYSTADNTFESTGSYALCYKCHSRNSILADESFSEHRRHVVDENTPCSACHDPHGISSIQGNPMNNSNLMNFDVTIVQPNARGEGPVFEDLGSFSGQCSLSCHGKDHDALGY